MPGPSLDLGTKAAGGTIVDGDTAAAPAGPRARPGRMQRAMRLPADQLAGLPQDPIRAPVLSPRTWTCPGPCTGPSSCFSSQTRRGQYPGYPRAAALPHPRETGSLLQLSAGASWESRSRAVQSSHGPQGGAPASQLSGAGGKSSRGVPFFPVSSSLIDSSTCTATGWRGGDVLDASRFLLQRHLPVRGDSQSRPIPQQHLPQHAGLHGGHPAIQR